MQSGRVRRARSLLATFLNAGGMQPVNWLRAIVSSVSVSARSPSSVGIWPVSRLPQGPGECDAVRRPQGKATGDSTTQEGGAGPDNPTAKTTQQGPKGAG